MKERLGHGSIATTGKYLHALPGADSAALEAFDAFRSRSAATAKPAPTDPREAQLSEMRELVAKLNRMLETWEQGSS